MSSETAAKPLINEFLAKFGIDTPEEINNLLVVAVPFSFLLAALATIRLFRVGHYLYDLASDGPTIREIERQSQSDN